MCEKAHMRESFAGVADKPCESPNQRHFKETLEEFYAKAKFIIFMHVTER